MNNIKDDLLKELTKLDINNRAPLITQCKYIKQNINLLSHEEKKYIGNMVLDDGRKLNENNEGIIINLDVIPNTLIYNIYDYIKEVLNEENYNLRRDS